MCLLTFLIGYQCSPLYWVACRFYCGLFRFAFAEVGFRFGMMDQTADIFAVCDEQQYCNNTAENHQ